MSDAVPTRPEIVTVIGALLSEILDDPDLEISDTSSAEDVPDWDSINHVKLIMALEEKYALRFNPDEINSLHEVGDLADLVRRELDKA